METASENMHRVQAGARGRQWSVAERCSAQAAGYGQPAGDRKPYTNVKGIAFALAVTCNN